MFHPHHEQFPGSRRQKMKMGSQGRWTFSLHWGGCVTLSLCGVPMATVSAGYGAVGSGAQLEEVALWEAGLEVCR